MGTGINCPFPDLQPGMWGSQLPKLRNVVAYWNWYVIQSSQGSWKNINQPARKNRPSKLKRLVRSFGPITKCQRIQPVMKIPKITSMQRTSTTDQGGSSPRPSVLGVKSPLTTHIVQQ